MTDAAACRDRCTRRQPGWRGRAARLRLALALVLPAVFGAGAGPAAGAVPAADSALAPRLAAIGELGRFDPATARAALLQLEVQARAAPLRLKARFLFHLSQAELGLGNTGTALALADELIAAATGVDDKVALARGLLGKSAALSELKQLKSAHELVWRADQLAADPGSADAQLRIDVAVASGQAHAEDGDFPAALAGLHNAAALARQSGDIIAQVVALNALARLFGQLREFDKGFATLDEAYALAAPAAVPGHVALLKNTEYGLAIDTGQRQRALGALQAGLQLERRIGANPLVVTSLVNLSDMSLKDQHYASAAAYARDAIGAARALGSSHREAVARFNLGAARLGQGQTAEGKRQLEAALEVLEAEGDMPALQAAWKEYADVLEQAGDAVGALRAIHRERALTDALFKKQRQEAIWSLEEKYGAEMKARQIAGLHQQNALKSAQLDNNRLQQRVWWLLAAVLLLGAAIIAVLYRNARRANLHLQRSNIELKHKSSHDPLTGLYNRRHFHDAMAARSPAQRRAIVGADGAPGAGALFLIDIDHFKHVNDAHGHAVGDQLLVSLAAQLRELLRETDMIVRWGGEEFLAWLPELKGSRLNEVAARLLAGIPAHPLAREDGAIAVTVSIGYALFPMPVRSPADAALDWERLLHLVDMALYMAKSHGRNRAYGLLSMARADQGALARLDDGLEQAWRDGAVDMALVVGR